LRDQAGDGVGTVQVEFAPRCRTSFEYQYAPQLALDRHRQMHSPAPAQQGLGCRRPSEAVACERASAAQYCQIGGVDGRSFRSGAMAAVAQSQCRQIGLELPQLRLVERQQWSERQQMIEGAVDSLLPEIGIAAQPPERVVKGMEVATVIRLIGRIHSSSFSTVIGSL